MTAGTARLQGGDAESALGSLLEDDVFVDFFNTFLNLPVFGQTPLYFLGENKWFLCPGIPPQQKAETDRFLRWLAEHRYSYFQKTELYLYYTLCKEFLQFPEAQGEGEELLAFWLRVEQLLLVDEPDESQRHRYRARLAVLKAMHLCEGSSVAVTCRVTADALLQISSSAPSGSVRREVLAQMQGRALLRLRCYWLPRFLTHCRLGLAWLPESSGLLREYELGAAAGAAPARPDLPPGPAALGQPEGCGGGPYSSRRTRQRLWRAAGHSDSGGSRRLEDGDFSGPQWVPMEDQGVAEGEAGGRAGQVLSSRACVLPSRPARSGWLLAAEHSGKPDEYTRPLPAFEALASTERVSADTPVCRLPAIPAAPPPRGDRRASETLHSALSADGLAGGPFRSFLESRSLVPELLRLGLWQDMDSFLHLLLKLQDGSGHTLRQVIAERIVGKYLSQDSGQRPLLEKDTARQLRRLLPAGQVTPWIHVARNEIAKVLCSSYDAFLDDEDAQFLSLVCLPQCNSILNPVRPRTRAALPPGGPNSPELQVRRMREALALCQACSFSGEPGLLSEDTWDLMALEDVRRGGSVHLNYRKTSVLDLPFEELALRHPRLAAQELSKNYRLFYTRKPFLASTKSKPVAASVFLKKTNLTFMKKGNSIVRRPSLRPRSLADVLRNPVNLDFFKRFLKAYNAHGALLFYQEVEKLRSVSKPRVLQARIVSIVNKFFSRHSDVEGFLQCDASIVSQIPKMRRVPLDVLFMAQDLVMKSLEARWFQQYQDTFPPCSSTVSDTCDRAAVLKSKLKRVWSIFSRYIKTVCKFRSAMKDIPTRSEFEHYLRHNFRDFSESGTELVSAHDAAGEGDSSHLRKRVVNSKLIAAGFLVNDLSFCLETERFRSLADAGVVMASAGMYGESDQAVLQSKADMIIRLFLRSEIAPRLRINISEVQREAILQSFSQGKVDRGLFHSAFITIFPNLVFCWKKFCSQKVMKTLYGDARDVKKKDIAVTPNYLYPTLQKDWHKKIKTILSVTDEFTTLRFTLNRGLQLILPQAKLDIKVCSSVIAPTKSPSHHLSVSPTSQAAEYVCTSFSIAGLSHYTSVHPGNLPK